MTALHLAVATLSAVTVMAGCSHVPPKVDSRTDLGGPQISGGVVVETVGEGSAAARAGIRPKDVLVSWVRPAAQITPPARGTFTSPFDVREIEIEQSPRAPVTIHGTREAKPFSLTLPAGNWELGVSPVRMETPELDAWVLAKKGDDLVTVGRSAEAEQLYASALVAAQRGGPSLAATVTEWKATALGQRSATGDASARPLAETAFREAVRLREASGEQSLRLAHDLWWLGRLATDPRTISDLFGRALEIQEKLAPGSVAEGHTLLNWGRVAQQERDFVNADRLLHRALPIFERFQPASLELSLVLNDLGIVRARSSDHAAAKVRFENALRIREKVAPDSTWVASSLGNLGTLAEARGDLAGADTHLTRALELWRKLTPQSFGTATSAMSLGRVRARNGQLASAKQLMQEAMGILEKTPGSVSLADRYNNLAELALQLGDTALAARSFQRALGVLETAAPSSSLRGSTMARLGRVLRDRGEWKEAEQLLSEALKLGDKSSNDAQVVEQSRALALLSITRGDLAAGETHLRRALAIDGKRQDSAASWAATANILASVYIRRGDYEGAEALVRDSIRITEKAAPASQEIAILHQRLGDLARERGDLTASLSELQESLRLQESLPENRIFKADTLVRLAHVTMELGQPLDGPETLTNKARALLETSDSHISSYAATLVTLGDIATRRKELPTAEQLLTRALGIRLRIGYAADVADSYWRLGELNRAAGRTEVAATQFEKSIEAIETQIERLGGAEEVRSGYAARYRQYYRSHIDALLALNQPAKAFHVAERSRARSLLKMFAERELTGSSELNADLARERVRVASEYDLVQARIVEVGARSDGGAEMQALRARLRELRDEREAIAEQIRTKSPRFASLHYPQPLDVTASHATLDPGTVLLEYVVTSDKTFLFVLQPTQRVSPDHPPLSVFTLPVGEAVIRGQIGRFRSLIERESTQADQTRSQAADAGARLYDLLMRPARDIVAKADRILISPDGPLHSLPFAALSSAQPGRAGRRYFIEDKPLHIVISATVYAELKKTRRPKTTDAAIAAFGDPVYPSTRGKPEDVADTDVRAFVRRGLDLKPLPDSRVEVEAIGRLFGARATVYTGAQASEERAKAVAPRAAYLHFAMHGILDERVPLNSAIVFSLPEMTTPGRDNGLLQAWEIIDQVRIDAELVTLSACETALGKELGGEGLVGLTRAFQYAGARSVLASLWSVGDKSTATLMTRFYKHLQSGRTKDDALRAAQIEMIRGSDRQPFHWAAFSLSGDWR